MLSVTGYELKHLVKMKKMKALSDWGDALVILLKLKIQILCLVSTRLQFMEKH